MHGTYPGLEKEQESPNRACPPAPFCWPSRTPASSPLTGRQAKPGTSAGLSGPRPTAGTLMPSTRGLFGSYAAAPSGPAPPSSPSAWGDAGAAEPTISALHPADSAPTVDGPAPKRARLAAGRGGAQLSAGWALTAASGAADSDSDGEEAVLSRRRPTPDKAAPAKAAGDASLAAAPMARVPAQHPPPTWAASLQLKQQASVEHAAAMALSPRRAAAEAGEAQQEDEWCGGGGSDMDKDDRQGWAGWQRFPLPLFNDVEE
ncbi:hypothetical protein ABPG75_004654 [Micractinium tetrahymenae]